MERQYDPDILDFDDDFLEYSKIASRQCKSGRASGGTAIFIKHETREHCNISISGQLPRKKFVKVIIIDDTNARIAEEVDFVENTDENAQDDYRLPSSSR